MIHAFGFEITVFQVIATIFGIGLMVFIHELGHFMMAKKFGIRVEKFTLGFGPEIAGFTYGETRYSLCVIPLGGMVKMPGEDINDASGRPDEFLSQPWYRRLIIAFFGPLMNYILAIILFTIVLVTWGVPKPAPEPIIGEVVSGYPAAQAGLKAADKVTRINGTAVVSWEDMATRIHSMAGQAVQLDILRGNENIKVNVQPRKDSASGYGVIGIAPSVVIEKVTFFPAVGLSTKMAWFQSVYTLKYLGEKIIRWEKPEVAGPIGVIQILAKAAKSGWESLLNLLAVISVALGLFNLLPIPLVDGGHIFQAIIEGIIRRPINKKIVQASNFVGLALIILIFVFATYSDIARMGTGMGGLK